MYDILFPDGSKCFCTRTYLEQSLLNWKTDEESDNCENQKQDENTSDFSTVSSEDDHESEDEEMKLMIQMGLPTSFTSRFVGKSPIKKKKSQSKKVENLYNEDNSADENIISDKPNENIISDQVDENIIADQAGENIIADQAGENIISDQADENIISDKDDETIISDRADTVSSTDIKTPYKKEKHIEKNELWFEIDNSISVGFKNYWERYGETIILYTWEKKYKREKVKSVDLKNCICNDPIEVNINSVCEEKNQTPTDISNKELNCDKTHSDEVLETFSEVEVKRNVNNTCPDITTYEQLSYDNQYITNEETNDNLISTLNTNMSLFGNNMVPFTVIDDTLSTNFYQEEGDSVENWNIEQWKEMWYNHVLYEMNTLYESFKKYYYKYMTIFEEDTTTISANEIMCRLKELNELKFVFCEPYPINVIRGGYNLFPFMKWWSWQLNKCYNLWETSIAKSLGCEDSNEQILDTFGCNKLKNSEKTDKRISHETVNTHVKENVPSSKKESHFSENECSENIADDIKKYYAQRYLLFSLFDEGIKLDNESWYSVTPEKIAEHVAERCRCDVIIDAFCGAGGNSIQFAFTCNHVIAVDLDPVKIELAKNNARIYGVEDRIDFICADFMKIGPDLKGDVIFLSPPWGGPEYQKTEGYDITSIQPDIYKLFDICQNITTNIALYMPKSTYINQLANLLNTTEYVEVEQNILNGKIKAVTAYFGLLCYDSSYYEDELY